MANQRQRAVLILGAGRSGTSIIARATQAIGVDLGDDFKPPSRKNPTGFFEDAGLLKLSKRLRRTLALRPDSLKLLADEDWQTPAVEALYEEFAQTIKDRFADSPIWGFKYARTMRLLPFWVKLFEQMEIEPAYIMPIRNPLSVARSRTKLDSHRGAQVNSDLEWLTNVVPYFELIKGNQIVAMDYDNLMQDPQQQLRRLADQLKLQHCADMQQGIESFCQSFLKPGLQHTRFSVDELMVDPQTHSLVKQAYRLLDQSANDQLSFAAHQFWDDWQKIAQQVSQLAPVLSQMDALNHQLRSAQWNPFSPIPAAIQLIKRVWMTL